MLKEMNFQILSDVHVDKLGIPVIKPVADILIIAGDICSPAGERYNQFLRYVSDMFLQVLVVKGNHDYHDCDTTAEQTSEFANVKYLNCNEMKIGEYTILGCTLWSKVPDHFLQTAATLSSDYEPRGNATYRGEQLTPLHTNSMHQQHREWLRDRLRSVDGKKIVITHHAPLVVGTSAPEHEARTGESRYLNTLFATDLSDIVIMADVWIFGHTHHYCDFMYGSTRVISNPVSGNGFKIQTI